MELVLPPLAWPRPMGQEMSLRTPEPLPLLEEGLGTRLYLLLWLQWGLPDSIKFSLPSHYPQFHLAGHKTNMYQNWSISVGMSKNWLQRPKNSRWTSIKEMSFRLSTTGPSWALLQTFWLTRRISPGHMMESIHPTLISPSQTSGHWMYRALHCLPSSLSIIIAYVIYKSCTVVMRWGLSSALPLHKYTISNFRATGICWLA